MAVADIILFAILGGFIFYGLFFGLVAAVGSLASFVIGLAAAANYYLPIADWTGQFFGGGALWRLIVFIALFTIANRLAALIFSIINKAFDIISIIPFLKSINRLAGAIFGLIEGAFVIGLIFYIVKNTRLLESTLGQALDASQIAPHIAVGTKLFLYLFPKILERLVLLFQ